MQNVIPLIKTTIMHKSDRQRFRLLTKHQVAIVIMICQEKIVGEITRKFDISKSTFFNTRLAIFKKLGVKSTVGLVKFVYKFKYLKF